MGINITCDFCGKNLTSTEQMPEFRVHVMAEALHHTSSFVFGILVRPPISEDKYFCGLSHLLGWLETNCILSPLSKPAVDAAIADGAEGES